MKITIDQDVKLPARGPRLKYDPIKNALLCMQVGESFFVPAAEVGTGFASNIVTKASRLNIKVSVRSWTQEEVKGWRVWRTK